MLDFIVDILVEIWGTLQAMAPYLLFGFLVAGILSVFISPAWVERHLGGRGLGAILRASLFGVPLPLCSCGVIPVAASLRRHGASKGATMAFLLSTPQTGVDSILATFSLLGPVFAVFRPLAAFITGALGGALVEVIEAKADGPDPQNRGEGACPHGVAETPPASILVQIVRYGLITLPRDLTKPLLVGLIAAGIIAALVPPDLFAGRWGEGLPAMLAMMLVGMPLYVCATSSIPIAAAMIGVGLSPGAALVFLMTGPATNAAAITTVWKLLGRRTAGLYLTVVAVSALASGLMLDWVYRAGDFTPGHSVHRLLPGPLQSVLAIMLLVLLVNALIPRRQSGRQCACRPDQH